MSETIAENLERAAGLIGGRAWGADKLRPRIYMKTGRRDAKVYFEFPDACYTTPADLVDSVKSLGGACLQVRIDDCGQHPNWYRGQVRRMMESFRQASLALSALSAGDEDLANAIMEAEEIDDMTAYDQAASHIANGRLAETRQVLAPWLETVDA